jgi:tetrahydromethanopterin S-methyltransferase subunit G
MADIEDNTEVKKEKRAYSRTGKYLSEDTLIQFAFHTATKEDLAAHKLDVINSLSQLKDDMNLRFEQVDKRFEQVDKSFDNLRGEMQQQRLASQSQFRWVLGVVITGIIIPVIYNLIPLISR